MSKPLHLDLLKDEERVSASPIRLRVMLPVFSFLAVLGVAVWWSVLIARAHTLALQKFELENKLAELKPAHNALLVLRAEEQDTIAALKQLDFYKNARVVFGKTFAKLAGEVPEKVQFTELRVPPPPLPLPQDPKNPLLGPTNSIERVTLRLAGRTSGPEPVKTLFQTLRTPAFTNLFRSAEIPKGAFRQDTTAFNPANRGLLLFELTCECAPRRFQ